jgi:hypothetical protein
MYTSYSILTNSLREISPIVEDYIDNFKSRYLQKTVTYKTLCVGELILGRSCITSRQ